MSATLVRRNTLLLAAGMACLTGMLQLVAAMSTITFVIVSGVEGLLGLGAALVLGATAVIAFPAGRAMDRRGRVPVLLAGFAAGAAGTALVAYAVSSESPIPAIPGFALIGTAMGIVNLARTAAGDMYPPARRARGISIVIFGSVFGAVLGPTVFSPLFGREGAGTETLVLGWLAGTAIMLVGMGIVSRVRLARPQAEPAGGRNPGAIGDSGRPLSELLREPGVVPALAAAVASFAVMVAVMNLSGHVIVSHGHARHEIFPVVSAHVVGMFGLALVVGGLVDRIGRPVALTGGLLLVSLSCASLAWVESVAGMAVALFVLGLGWSFSFVAATAELSDATEEVERGRLLGFNDALSAGLGATLALLGGLTLSAAGAAALGVGAAAIALAPVSWYAASARLRPART